MRFRYTATARNVSLRRKDLIWARGGCRRVPYLNRAAVRPRSGTGRCTSKRSSGRRRRRRTIMRSAARAARDAAMPAIDLRGVIGAATGSAASLVEVSVMLPTWSPRVCTRADLLHQRCRTARRHRRRRSPLIRRCTTHLRERHSWCRLPCTPRTDEALQRDHTYPVLRVRH